MTERELVVVPFERHVERALSEGAARGGARASSWGKLTDDLAQAILFGAEIGLRRATPEHTRLALADVAASLDTPLFVRARMLGALSWEHMLDALDDAIVELRRADVDPAMLRALARAKPALAPRASLLAAALEALDLRLSKSALLDGRAIEAALAAAIEASHGEHVAEVIASALGARTLVLRSFVTFDAAIARMVRALESALGRIGGGVRIELASFATPLDALRERDPLEILIDRASALLGIPPETTTLTRRLGDFTGDSSPADPSKVAIGIAESAEAQARAAVLSVLRALRAGTPIERIAVVTPSADEESLVPLRRLFDEAGIPIYDARGPAPAHAGIVALALEALTIGARGLPRRDVARLLRSTYVDGRLLSRDRSRGLAPIATIASALEGTPTTPRETPRATLHHTAALGLRDREDREMLLEITDRVGAILEAPARARTRADHAIAARTLFDELGLRVRALGLAKTVLGTDLVPTGVARAELRALATDSHAWEALTSALARYEAAALDLGLERVVPAEVFEHELRRALEAGPPLPSGGRAFAIRVGRLNELAFEPLDHVVVLDANDGVLPRHGGDDGLVSSELSSALREANGRRAPESEGERAAAQLAGLALLVDRASSVLVVYRTEDDGGAALAPAAFVLWLERAGVAVTRTSDAPRAQTPVSPREHELLLLAIAPAYAQRSPSALRRAEREAERERWHDVIDADPLALASEVTGALTLDPDVRLVMEQETGGGGRSLSVTALERVASCPFQGFASVVLRAGEELSPEDRPDAREEGTMVHDALRVVFEGVRELLALRPRDPEAIRERARAILDRHFAEDAAPLRALAIARLREEVHRVLEVAVADLEWDFEGAEVPFGGREGVGPFLAEAGGRHLSLRGTIDRVDVSHSRAAVRVIDYKRAVRAHVRPDDLGTVRLQIPVYAARAREAHGVAVGEGAYLPTQTPELGPSADLRARLATLLDDDAKELRRSLVAIADVPRRGDVAPRPFAKATCERCDLDGGCRRPRFVSGDLEKSEDE